MDAYLLLWDHVLLCVIFHSPLLQGEGNQTGGLVMLGGKNFIRAW